MADDGGFDVDDMLENALESKSTESAGAPKEASVPDKGKENGSSKKKKDKTRSGSRSRRYCD
ncbi:hypothetical protein NECAME_07839 [Necator americanus]|uniref:Uncharacterized protein n=1 Tax=Necator americanus TaxID=51031 RepID=W2TLU2_NECAM|nr:hypothetical protein NECAME_07839 [Necator americanus]ETN82728.1 hypothetical protein NECAME_07839 [Necator americanus]